MMGGGYTGDIGGSLQFDPFDFAVALWSPVEPPWSLLEVPLWSSKLSGFPGAFCLLELAGALCAALRTPFSLLAMEVPAGLNWVL